MNSVRDAQFAITKIKSMQTEKTDIKEITGKIDITRVPQHIAIIMDGNGRWAKRRAMERSEGHSEGVNSVTRITRLASDIGVRYLTLYAFSTENWNRPRAEVDTLMNLIAWTIKRETPDLVANNVKLHVAGDFMQMPEETRRCLQEGLDATAGCTGLNLILCLSYSSRWEITEAARKLAHLAMRGEIDPADISQDTISSLLTTGDFPDPDLLIRTGGEQRVSNFLTWQIAYSELYFTPVLWPDFGKDAFIEAIADFQNRERRFGKTSEQVAHITGPGNK